MACKEDKTKKCFTFIWKVENASYWWDFEDLQSPKFLVGEIGESEWKLCLQFSYCDGYSSSQLKLHRQEDENDMVSVEIDCEIAVLSTNGTALHFFENNRLIGYNECIIYDKLPSRNELFRAKRCIFLPQDTLTVRCRIWKSNGEMSQNVLCQARTRIAVEKISFLWHIEDFSDLTSVDELDYKIKSFHDGQECMSIELSFSNGLMYEETIHLKVVFNHQNIKVSTLELSIVDSSKKTVKCFGSEFWFDVDYSGEFTLFATKQELMEKKNVYLPNDTLSFLCECSFFFGNITQEIERTSFGCLAIENEKLESLGMNKQKELPFPKDILIEDFKSMLNNSSLSDVNLKTKNKTYPAHKFILSVRSPVFKAMFSNDMREKINDCVDIDDISDETVLQMLRYIYCAEVEDVDWDRAIELYEAADKYEILNLKDLCSSYLKTHLNPNNACKALVLSDMHLDEDFKHLVQDFILSKGEIIINSEDWDQLMENNVKLAAETMRRKYQEIPK